MISDLDIDGGFGFPHLVSLHVVGATPDALLSIFQGIAETSDHDVTAVTNSFCDVFGLGIEEDFVLHIPTRSEFFPCHQLAHATRE